jgi:hypothetical protein
MYLKVVFAPNLFVGGRPGRVEGECMGFEEEEELVSMTHASTAQYPDQLQVYYTGVSKRQLIKGTKNVRMQLLDKWVDHQ